MAGTNTAPARPSTSRMSIGRGWDTERWVAVIVILALATLILIRMGFRGINVAGVSASIS